MALLNDAAKMEFNPTPVPTIDPTPTPIPPVGGTSPIQSTDSSYSPSLEDLYPVTPDAVAPGVPEIATVTENDPSVAQIGQTTIGDVTGADVTTNDASVAEVGTPGTAQADTGMLSAAEGITASQTNLTPEQQVDAELTRILGEDSPLLAQARVKAAQQANARGLSNSSMAAGMSTAEMVKAALPMAQQNAAQAATRELSNTNMRQQAGMFTASEQNRLSALEAELGTSVSVFNAEQLNQAESLAAQMRVALEQQDTAAYNSAAQQLAELQRSAQAQQGDIDAQRAALEAQMATALQQQDTAAYNAAAQQLTNIQFAAEQQAAEAQNRLNEQTMAQVTALNEQYLRGSQAMDLATIQGTYQQIISTNATAGNIYQSYFDGIASVMNDPNMTPTQIATAVENMQSMLEASLRMISEMNDMDFGDIGETLPGGSVSDVTPGVPEVTPNTGPGGALGGRR